MPKSNIMTYIGVFCFVQNLVCAGVQSAEGILFKGLEMARIEPGKFMMGSSESESGEYTTDEQQHIVTISRAFEIGIYEVTQGLWLEIMGSNPSRFKQCGSDCPVENITWTDAQAFIAKLNSRFPGKNYRLPSEAEWEYACRAGTTESYAGNLDTICWYKDNANDIPHPVGMKQSNSWGLHDMHGNVWEWCNDWYGAYQKDEATDPAGPSSGSFKICRGGSCSNVRDACRSENRGMGKPDFKTEFIGLRLARSLP